MTIESFSSYDFRMMDMIKMMNMMTMTLIRMTNEECLNA